MNNFGNRKFTESLVQNLCPGRGIAFRDERLLFGGATVSSVYQVSTRYCCGFVCICMHVCVKTSGFYQHSMSPVQYEGYYPCFVMRKL